MKKVGLILLVVAAGMVFAGCGRKQKSLEEMQEPLSVEALSNMTTSASTLPAPAPEPTQVAPAQVAPSAPVKLEALPPSGSGKPSNQEIQAALKNSGYYTGNVDGKIGPMTKKAIEAFQKANNLKADGKVGPKTWEALKAYLNSAPAPVVPQEARPAKKR